MEHKAYTFKVKAATAEGEVGKFAGFASTFNEDLAGDIVMPGAFKDAIAAQPSSGYPLLLSHRQDSVLGGIKVRETADGLHGDGEIDLADETGRSTFNNVSKGWLRGLSIGFGIEPGGVEYDDRGRRLLKRLRLFEVSLTPTPANPEAVVTGVKSLQSWLKALETRESIDPGLMAEIAEIEKGLAALKRKHAGAADLDGAILAKLQRLARPEAWV